MERSKKIIDEHFIQYHRYYEIVCKRYYKNRYLWEDLLQETYLGFLKVKEPVIIEYHFNQDLKKIGLLIIASLYQKRKQKKCHSDSKDSPLSETATNCTNEYDYYNDIFNTVIVDDNTEWIEKERKLDTVNSLVMMNKDNNLVQLLIAISKEGLSKVARDNDSTRYKLKKETDEVKEHFKYLIS